MRNPTGFVVAIIGILSLGIFLSLTVIVLGIDAVIADESSNGASVLSALLAENGQTVLVATVGSIATIAGGALGYQMGLSTPMPEEGSKDELRSPADKPDVAVAKTQEDNEGDFWEE